MIAFRLTALATAAGLLPYLFACASTTPTPAPTAAPEGLVAAKSPTAGAQPQPAGGAQDGGNPLASAKIAPDSDPSIVILDLVVRQGKCVRLEKMPGTLAKLPDAEFRVELAETVAEGRRNPGSALTEWLVLATEYQELCQLYGAEEHNAAKYIGDGLPLEEEVVDRSLQQKRCAFLSTLDESQAWPYEVRFGNEVLRRDFNEAEITRQLWKTNLEEYLSTCSSTLSKRGKIRAEAQIARLDRIIGLDDPTLIDLRSNMLTSLEKGNEKKVLAYAKAIAEREAALDGRRASEYEAKLASIEKTLSEQRTAVAMNAAEVKAAVNQAQQPQGATALSANAAQTSENVAKTAENVARAAKATKTAVNIARAFF